MSSKGGILIVDDDPDFCDAVTTALEAEGYSVRCASNGRQGLDMMREKRPGLVFLDVIMDTPTEGVYISQEIANDPGLRNVPVVMITSITDSEYLGDFPTDSTLQIDMFLSKPVPLRKFVEIANRILQREGA
jgi:CheY-like chemotaxis protein